MKKRLSHFPYNERSRPGWTPSTSLQKPLSPIRSTMKTVTYVPGTFVTLVPGPYILPRRGGENVVGGGFEVNCITAAMSEAPKEASTRYSSSDDRGEEMRWKIIR